MASSSLVATAGTTCSIIGLGINGASSVMLVVVLASMLAIDPSLPSSDTSPLNILLKPLKLAILPQPDNDHSSDSQNSTVGDSVLMLFAAIMTPYKTTPR